MIRVASTECPQGIEERCNELATRRVSGGVPALAVSGPQRTPQRRSCNTNSPGAEPASPIRVSAPTTGAGAAHALVQPVGEDLPATLRRQRITTQQGDQPLASLALPFATNYPVDASELDVPHFG